MLVDVVMPKMGESIQEGKVLRWAKKVGDVIRKEETILLWAGRLLFEIERDGVLTRIDMLPGDRVHVAPKTVHRMTAIEDCDIFEVSTPELDDVVRLEDRYGREDAQRT